MLKFIPEPQEGNIEYKQNLINLTYERIEKYTTQLNFRMNEGSGKVYYIIGIHDKGHIIGLNKVNIITSIVNFFKIVKNLGKMDIIYNIYTLHNDEISFEKKYICILKVENKNFKRDAKFLV